MKGLIKGLSFLIVIILLLSAVIPAYALQNECFTDTEELYENEEVIVESVNKLIYGEDNNQINSESIENETIIKVYDLEKAYEEIDQSFYDEIEALNNYRYNMFVTNNNENFLLSFIKGKPVDEKIAHMFTDEEFSKLKSVEGKWYVPMAKKTPYKLNYQSAVEALIEHYDIEADEVLYLNGINSYSSIIAVLCSENNIIGFIPLDYFTANGTDEIEAGGFNSEMPSVFSVEEMNNFLKESYNYEEQGMLLGGGNEIVKKSKDERINLLWIIIPLLTLICSLAIIEIVGKTNRGKIK